MPSGLITQEFQEFMQGVQEGMGQLLDLVAGFDGAEEKIRLMLNQILKILKF